MNDIEHNVLFNIAEDCREIRKCFETYKAIYVSNLEALVLSMQEIIKSLIENK